MKVVLKRGSDKYHKPHATKTEPTCHAISRNGEDWLERDKEEAERWKDPCQNEQCFGESNHTYSDIQTLHD